MTENGEKQSAKDEGEKTSNAGGLETTPSNSTAERDAQTKEMSTKNHQSPPKGADGTPASSSPKKRRKVNHGGFLAFLFFRMLELSLLIYIIFPRFSFESW